MQKGTRPGEAWGALVLLDVSAAFPLLNQEFMLKALVTTFAKMNLEINWTVGKTEAIVSYRGKKSVQLLEDKRQSDGSFAIKVPGTDKLLHMVDQYVHLGGIVCKNKNTMPDAKAKTKSALNAYAPLAMKVFGSTSLDVETKLAFMWSLVMSRLLFNAHILVPGSAYIKELNQTYMRVLRKIIGAERFGRTICDREGAVNVVFACEG